MFKAVLFAVCIFSFVSNHLTMWHWLALNLSLSGARIKGTYRHAPVHFALWERILLGCPNLSQIQDLPEPASPDPKVVDMWLPLCPYLFYCHPLKCGKRGKKLRERLVLYFHVTLRSDLAWVFPFLRMCELSQAYGSCLSFVALGRPGAEAWTLLV